MSKINGFDLDGVISIGIHPGPNDVIITGRSIEESPETLLMLQEKGITNEVFFNPLPYNEKTRTSSGQHKARTLKTLKQLKIPITNFFEDDPIQITEIEKECPWVDIVYVKHDLTNKENQRAPEYQEGNK